LKKGISLFLPKSSSKSATEWTAKEGPDLSDIGVQEAELSSLFSQVLQQYSSYKEDSRVFLKEIRKAEEELESLEKERKTCASKLEEALKKDKPRNDLTIKLASLDRLLLDTKATIYTLKRRKYAAHLALQYDSLALLGNQCLSISDLN
jgi:predicted RNase H-like nuclease (RuvC/YqgF family)